MRRRRRRARANPTSTGLILAVLAGSAVLGVGAYFLLKPAPAPAPTPPIGTPLALNELGSSSAACANATHLYKLYNASGNSSEKQAADGWAAQCTAAGGTYSTT
jgi:hypothetical protein